ncbi:Exopolyphosphatase [Saxophila tyrrhenica]|uniref:Exopolyphosphatase n=1 Tax=Saxophila tyrrhenica TaxID=1690608 RepID=A0AAV9NZ54_9PEZI|nr:Exopolyphosphatase [Saxophila tyrrhenica]
MSRMSVAAFLSKAKSSLAQSLRSKGDTPAAFVIGNESADLDSITCAIVYGYVHSNTPAARKAGKYIIPVTNIPASELRLRPELTALLKHANLKPSDLVTLDDLGKIQDVLPPSTTSWTLVDHNVLQDALGEHFSASVTGVIDHHEDEGKVPEDAQPRIIEKTGSCSSHVANYCRETWEHVSSGASTSGAALGQGDGAIDDSAYTVTWDAHVAKLALGSILIDTINLGDSNKVTEHDKKAVKYLEAKINVSPQTSKTYDRNTFYQEINNAKSNLDELSLQDILGKDYKQWTEGDLRLGISSCVRSIEYLESKQENLVPGLIKFAKEHDLDIFAVMTAHNDGASFQRQLLLLAVKEGRAIDLTKKFADQFEQKLQLDHSTTKSEDSEALWLQLWEQKNLAASRKQVAPMLREAMR